MLLQNGRIDSQYPLKYMGSATFDSGLCINKDGSRFNKYYGYGGINLIASFPNGYVCPYTWILEIKAGGMSCTYGIVSNGTIGTSNLAGGRNLVTLIQSEGLFSSNIKGELELNLSCVGIGNITSSNLSGSVYITSSIDGVGSIDAVSNAIGILVSEILGESELTSDAVGSINLEVIMDGSGIIYNANMAGGYYLDGIIESTSELYGQLSGLGIMQMVIEIGARPSAYDIASAIFGSIAADNNIPLTIGEKINSAGSAGDPWTTTLPGSYSEGTAGYMISNIYTWVTRKLLSVAKFLGLK